jgi:uncharacterized protein (UPF0335 family)
MSEPIAPDLLKSLIDRIERLSEEKAELSQDIKEVYAEAKSQGFDTKILRKVIARRKKGTLAALEEDARIELYENALGQMKLPLDDAA